MTPSPSPFQISQGISNQFGKVRREDRETGVIDSILKEASQSGDPADMDAIMGKLLSQVSPEKQPGIAKFLEAKKNQILNQQREEADVFFGLDPRIAKGSPDIRKERIKTVESKRRFDEIVNNQGLSQQKSQDGTQSPRTLSDLSDEQLIQASNIPGVSDPVKQELKNRQQAAKEDRADIRETRRQTHPLKIKIIDAAESSREGIRNGNQLLQSIEEGGITNPTAATLLDAMPFNLGQRFLSNEAVVYRANLINQYKGLRQIFQGQTRVKEIELLEQKIPDLYLTDSQKKGIIENNVETLKWDILKEQAAKEVEEESPNSTALQFNSLVNQKMSSAANDFIDKQRSVIDQAEAFKDVLLDPSNPEHLEIMQQMRKEAGGNVKKALQLGHKKGYKFLGVDG